MKPWPRVVSASWAVALALGHAACDLNEPPDPAAAFAAALGCYDVTLGPWTEMEQDHPVLAAARPPEDDSLIHVIPPRIQLSDEPTRYSTPEHRTWSASAPPGALPVGLPQQVWALDEDGRLTLGYGNGLSGFGGVLSPHGNGWAGAMEAWTDVEGTTRWERQVTLLRVDCASPPPVTDDSVWLLPRSIQLEGGMSLTLDEPPPEGLPTYERPNHAPGVASRTVGLFAGADSVVMVTNWGRVGLVELTFLPPATPDALLERLTAEFGPGYSFEWPGTEQPSGSVTWDGRITVLAVVRHVSGGFRVLLNDPRVR